MNRKKMLLKFFLNVALLAFLASCGEDSVTVEKVAENSGMNSVTSVENLPYCSSELEGSIYWLKDSISFRTCVKGSWVDPNAGTVSVGKFTCSTEMLSDSTGLKILCNGDSVGVVYNGAKGEKGDQGIQGETGATGDTGSSGTKGDKGDLGLTGEGCSVKYSTSTIVVIECGETHIEIPLDEYFNEYDEEGAQDWEEAGIDPRDNLVVTGVTQKGPFVVGSSVTAYELKNGSTLKQTGNSYSGTIMSNDGRFDVRTVTLASPFIYLVADGYYRNEVTGENSKSQIKLRAISNVASRSNVNVNLLTHLEYDRIVYLVTSKKMKIAAAKKQAAEEIFNTFYIDPSNFDKSSEDLDVFGQTEQDAALLAISIMLQGDRSEAELTTLLTSFSYTLAERGSWTDKSKRAEIADFMMLRDYQGMYPKYLENVASWRLSSNPPLDFSRYARNFWNQELGLGKCNSDSLGIVKKADNSYSNYGGNAFGNPEYMNMRFICREDKMWYPATDFEKDTYKQSAEPGTVIAGNVNSHIFYIADADGSWRVATELEYNTNPAKCNLSGNFVNGLRDHSIDYKCTEIDGKKTWLHVSHMDSLAGLACNSERNGRFTLLKGSYSYFECVDNEWVTSIKKKNLRKIKAKTLENTDYEFEAVGHGQLLWMSHNYDYTPDYSNEEYSDYQKFIWCPRKENERKIYGCYYRFPAAIGVPDSRYLLNSAADEGKMSNKIRGLCPAGWRLPSSSDFSNLHYYIYGRELGVDQFWAEGDSLGFNVNYAGDFAFYMYENDGSCDRKDVCTPTTVCEEEKECKMEPSCSLEPVCGSEEVCVEVDDCSDQEVCRDQNVCEEVDDCSDQEVCRDQNVCEEVEDCRDQEVCRDQNVCEEVEDCSGQEVCRDQNVCVEVDDCSDQEVCSDQEICDEAGNCEMQNVCQTENVCNGTKQQCEMQNVCQTENVCNGTKQQCEMQNICQTENVCNGTKQQCEMQNICQTENVCNGTKQQCEMKNVCQTENVCNGKKQQCEMQNVCREQNVCTDVEVCTPKQVCHEESSCHEEEVSCEEAIKSLWDGTASDELYYRGWQYGSNLRRFSAWTGDTDSPSNATEIELQPDGVCTVGSSKDFGISIRCVRAYNDDEFDFMKASSSDEVLDMTGIAQDWQEP